MNFTWTKSASAYPVVSAKTNILGVIEPSTTTAGGDLKEPDKHESANRKLEIHLIA
jgi:hypothetical protein